jgi:hypothetical protein
MKGEIFERAKYIVPKIVENIIKIAWKVILIDEIAIEIVWGAFNLFGLYITLRLVKQILLIAEHMPLEVKTSLLELVEERVGQRIMLTGHLFEKGESQLWQIFKIYHILEAEINVLKSLIMDSRNDVMLYDNFIIEPDRTSVHLPVPRMTEVLKSSYCC